MHYEAAENRGEPDLNESISGKDCHNTHIPAALWRLSRPSPSGTCHQIEGKPMYSYRFDEVLSFHEPGLAPVRKGAEWFHILPDGSKAYAMTFERAWGFYEGLASVVSRGNAYHILLDGTPAYENRFSWCGNFQYGLCTVREFNGRYRHILPDGMPAYAETYRYAGDYREGAAVVQTDDGLHMHIDADGKPLNGRKILDLGPFHKGIATARDSSGWFHIDRNGNAVYEDDHRLLQV